MRFGRRASVRPAQGSTEDETLFINIQRAQQSLVKSHEILSDAILRSEVAESGLTKRSGSPPCCPPTYALL